MNRHAEYNLVFVRTRNDYGDGSEFNCYLKNSNDNQYYGLAEKIRYMSHPISAEGLIDEIEAAANNAYYEPFYSLDADTASDTDGIEIIPPNVKIDNYLSVPFQHMKEILTEWIEFMTS